MHSSSEIISPKTIYDTMTAFLIKKDTAGDATLEYGLGGDELEEANRIFQSYRLEPADTISLYWTSVKSVPASEEYTFPPKRQLDINLDTDEPKGRTLSVMYGFEVDFLGRFGANKKFIVSDNDRTFSEYGQSLESYEIVQVDPTELSNVRAYQLETITGISVLEPAEYTALGALAHYLKNRV